MNFFANFFELYTRLKIDLQKIMNKNFLCSSSKGKSVKHLNQKLDIIDQRYPSIQMFLEMKPRMVNQITNVNGGV